MRSSCPGRSGSTGALQAGDDLREVPWSPVWAPRIPWACRERGGRPAASPRQGPCWGTDACSLRRGRWRWAELPAASASSTAGRTGAPGFGDLALAERTGCRFLRGGASRQATRPGAAMRSAARVPRRGAAVARGDEQRSGVGGGLGRRSGQRACDRDRWSARRLALPKRWANGAARTADRPCGRHSSVTVRVGHTRSVRSGE
jgi:hypothetical protein